MVIVIGVFLPTIRYHARLIGCERLIKRVDLSTDIEVGFYDMLRALTSQCRDGAGRRASWGSRAPMWFTAWSVVQDIEALAAELKVFVPGARGVNDVFRRVAESSDSLAIPPKVQGGIVAEIMDITARARRLCHPALFSVDGACPVCGEVKSPDNHLANALEVHDYWAECRACGATWEGDRIVTLAEALGLGGVI